VGATSAWTRAEHEAGLALFIQPGYRKRFRALMAMNDRHRHAKLYDSLNHFEDTRLDTRFARRVAERNLPSGRLIEILEAKGAPATCYLVSENRKLDGRTTALRETLRQVVDEPGYTAGVLFSCIPGRLGFYHYDEGWGQEAYVLERPGCSLTEPHHNDRRLP